MEFFPSKKSNNRGSLFSCPCAVLGFDFAILLPTAWPYFGSAWLSLAQLGSAWLSLAMSIGHWTGACWAFTIEPIKLSFILNGVCSPSKVNYCSNLFEVFYTKSDGYQLKALIYLYGDHVWKKGRQTRDAKIAGQEKGEVKKKLVYIYHINVCVYSLDECDWTQF